MADTPQNSETAAREAITAEAISRAWRTYTAIVGIPRGTSGLLRAKCAEGLRAVLEEFAVALRPASLPGELTEAMVEAGRMAFRARYWTGDRNGDWDAAFRAGLTAALLSTTTQTEG